MVPPGIDNALVFDLCNAREQHFLLELIQQEEPGSLDDHPLPELYALLRALERMWGGADAKRLTVPPGLMYYLVAYATYAHHVHEDVEEWRAGAVHDVYHILQGFMESVARAIRGKAIVKQKDDGMYMDLFRIPQWFYDSESGRFVLVE
jgi:hypothetical protein